MTAAQPLAIANPLAERMHKGELGLTLMVRQARMVDIALAAGCVAPAYCGIA